MKWPVIKKEKKKESVAGPDGTNYHRYLWGTSSFMFLFFEILLFL